MTFAPTIGPAGEPPSRFSEPSSPVVRRGGRTYFVASLVSQVSALVRSIVLARLLGPEQMGLAQTLVVTASFFDQISDTGADRFLIQDRDGDTTEVQKVVQLAYVGRGLMIALGLLIVAIPVSHFFNAPRLAAGLAVFTVSPLIFGFLHLDMRRAQRWHDFRSEAVCMMVSEFTGLIATAIAAWLTRDFTAILYGLITRALVQVIVSHLRAERPYALGWDRSHGARLARFAGPLMVSGLMLFIGSQGDRVMVGKMLGIAALGRYSVIILLIYYPSALLLRYIHAVYMPMVAAMRDDPAGRDRVSDRLGGQTQLLALGMAVGFALVAPLVVPWLYGRRYAESALVIALIGILQSTRFLINWPTTVALAMGQSRTVLISNASRLLVFPGAWIGFHVWHGLMGVVCGFLGGEVVSIAVALVLVNRDTDSSPRHGFDRFGLFLLTAGAIVGWNLAWPRLALVTGAAAACGTMALIAVCLLREKQTIRDLLQAVSRQVRRG